MNYSEQHEIEKSMNMHVFSFNRTFQVIGLISSVTSQESEDINNKLYNKQRNTYYNMVNML